MKSDKRTRTAEASAFMVVPLVITAAMALLLGLMPDGIFHFFELASNSAASIFSGVAR